MSKSERAIVKSSLLVWARESAGMDRGDAAHRLDVSVSRLESWETGTEAPTVVQLRRAAHAYRVPMAAFYLPTPPPLFQPPVKDFRHLPGKAEAAYAPELRLHMRWALERRQVALELCEALGETAPVLALTATIDGNVEATAAEVRRALGITMDVQRKWRQADTAFRAWVAAVEEAGALVLQAKGIELDEMRGYSIAQVPFPIIAVNRKDTPAGQVFTLLHELAHVLLRTSGVCELDEASGRQPPVEVFCNRLAGAILVPQADLIHEPAVARHAGSEWSDDELGALAIRYGVSREVMLRRLLLAGKTTQDFYRKRRALLLSQYEKRKPMKEGGFLPPATDAIKSVGRRFVRLVLTAYHAERITQNDLSDYLGLRLKHLDKIEALAGT